MIDVCLKEWYAKPVAREWVWRCIGCAIVHPLTLPIWSKVTPNSEYMSQCNVYLASFKMTKIDQINATESTFLSTKIQTLLISTHQQVFDSVSMNLLVLRPWS